jgi:hypothetical protein
MNSWIFLAVMGVYGDCGFWVCGTVIEFISGCFESLTMIFILRKDALVDVLL